MKVRKYEYYACDFETTVFDGQESTEVWASACVKLYTEDVKIFHSIKDTYDFFINSNQNIIAYYHNLKFDGAFWLNFLLERKELKQAYNKSGDDEYKVEWLTEKDMPNNTFKYCISDMGQWYCITIKVHNKIIQIRDSLKLLPFSVRKIGKDFKTKHQKLEMEYKGERYAGCVITDEEKEYIKNDVLVVKEALEVMFNEGHDKMTIGSCCLAEYKKTFMYSGFDTFKKLFPDMTEYELSEEHTYANADAWIRKSYKGGWCYLVKGKENKIARKGITADVNSLYPSMMSSESGNRFPVGLPTFWSGNFIPDSALDDKHYYFVRIRTRFKIKTGYLPFIQIKGNYLYKGTECLTTSDYYDKKTDKYYSNYYDMLGRLHDTFVELTLTMTDYVLLQEHYNLIDCEIIDGCYFDAYTGIFDEYIDKYRKMKIESTGALRQLAKLFLNNLYGKMATGDDSSFKVAYLKDDGSVGFYTVEEHNKKTGYIPVGSAITSYARNFTIRAAQKNYHGANKPGFIYADTDSIHCDISAEQVKGIKVHDKNFCCWKLESYWDEAIFVRQKTYIEHVTHEDGEPVTPYYNVKCAGMPPRCKELFLKSMEGVSDEELEKYPVAAREFVRTKRTLKDFKCGLIVPGKLLPKRIKGGIVLTETQYEMRAL